MAATKTINFLPEIFRTDSNKKFLAATLDQLVSEPNFKRVNGYIGRKFAPTYRSTDSYVEEISKQRQDYQLEPGAVVYNLETNNVDFYSSYIDLVNKVKYYGAPTDNHSRLFGSEFYSFDGKFDFDKFINFSQYYWMPDGPESVSVTANSVPMEYTWDVEVDTTTGAWKFSNRNKVDLNPSITLAYGGTYTFNVKSGEFWIQTEATTTGYNPLHPGVYLRDVLGVENNGASSGTVVFKVPQPSGQDRYTQMIDPVNGIEVDFATTLSYRDLQGTTLDTFTNVLNGIDGVKSSPDGKKIIFVGSGIDDIFWTVESNVDQQTQTPIDPSLVIPATDRTKTWIVQVDINNIISLIPYDPIEKNKAVYVKSGVQNASRYFYVDYTGFYKVIPLITAPLTSLFYQNSQSGTGTGVINLVNPGNAVINPDNEIIGKKYYTSPNGVTFTNGLKIRFDSTVFPASYYAYSFDDYIDWKGAVVSSGGTVTGDDQNGYAYIGDKLIGEWNTVTGLIYKEWYIEGVGTGIKLVNANTLIAPELPNLNSQDYITINRSSVDANAWSRSNRWFHVDVIRATDKHNNSITSIDQTARAKRAIIEFEPNIKLFQYGKVSLDPINQLDYVITDAYTQVETKIATNPNSLTITNNGASVTLNNGDRVIFANDANPVVRKKIYKFKIVDVSENPFAHLYIGLIVESGSADVQEGNDLLVLVTGGQNANKEFYFDGTNWILCQQKYAVNQPPLFDAFDENGISFGDQNTYVNTSFAGTTIFGYMEGTGANDPVLGFPLSYRTFNNIGDIQFENSWDSQEFTYLVSPNTFSKKINSGYLHITKDLDNYQEANIWTKVVEPSKQYQVINHIADGTNNLFEIDILPNPSTTTDSYKALPNLKVYVNNEFIAVDNFGLAQVGVRYAVLINPLILKKGDAVDILIYSDSVSKMGYFQTPQNLNNNSLNTNFESLTLGQLRNHLTRLSQNSQDIVGSVPGESNLRDLNIKQQGGLILKHSSPVVYSNLFLVDSTLSFVDSLRLAQREYNKIKNKIVELSTTIQIDVNDIAGSLDTILYSINGVKNKNFPWYHSDMIPWGKNKQVLPSYTVLDPRIREYELSSVFDPYALSNKAVLIYLTRSSNGVTTTRLLTHEVEYVFSKTSPGFTILDSFNLNYDDVLTVVEYFDTDGNFIPETPTKLGLYPKYVPEIFVDNTYANGPVTVIRGHDGSITPAYNDYRDDLLLEFEQRIYNNIKISFAHEDLIQHTPGAFRVSDYSLTEWNQSLSSSFLTWVGNNRLDYSTNNYFQSSNPWTWNYKNFKDNMDPGKPVSERDYLQGTWRAVYQYFFDTDRPHTHPWEMLGFLVKPDYWDERYGPGPYTGGNLILWNDLMEGYIHAGPRAGYDLRYARRRIVDEATGTIVRLGLVDIIPVDESGNLLPPSQILVSNFNSSTANASYAFGDFGPAETAWRRSSDYPYAVTLASSLLKPAEFFGSYINIDRIIYNTKFGQWVTKDTNQHVIPTAIEVNGFIDSNNVIQRTAGYINWISDYLKNTGIGDPQTLIKTYLRNLNTQLSYKVAGFTDKNYVKVLAEQGSPNGTNDSIIIPDSNYKIELCKSVPVSRIVYSAVIVEKSQNGYTVSGYNLNSPYFTIVPSKASNNSYSVKVGKSTGVIYKDYQRVRVRVPYGHEFKTTQEVTDFLVSYQRHLQSQGFVFTEYDQDLKAKQDWILSVKEFLTWAQQGWVSGNAIILSPVNQKLSVFQKDAVVDEITNLPTGSRLLDPNFTVIKTNAMTVMRQDNQFTVETIKGQTIAFADLNMVQYEHVMIFDNVTSFNDVIYSPDTGNRQYRLKFVGSKTADWTGALNPPGFIYNSETVDEWLPGVDYKKGSLVAYKTSYFVALNNVVASELFDTRYWKQINKDQIKTGLLPNFATNAAKLENFYDIDNQPVNETLNFYSNGITGFRERQFLTDLSIDVETQSKFYQGYIKQKGTKNSVLALAQAQIANISNEVNLYEEWALRVGEYGAVDSNKFVEVILNEGTVTSNPVPLEFLETAAAKTLGFSSYRPSEIYQSSLGYTPNIFDPYETSASKHMLPVAGYASIEQVNTTIFDLANYADLQAIVDNIGVGYTIWTAKGFGGSWDVYRVSETGCQVVELNYSIDNVAEFVTNQSHNLSAGDIIAAKGFDNRFDGFYQVIGVPAANRLSVVLRRNYSVLSQLITVTGRGLLFKLTSSRINSASDIETIKPKYGWATNDKVWVDNLDSNGNWGVYNKTEPWGFTTQINLNSSEYTGNDQFGSSVKLSKDASILYTGAPGGSGVGRAAIFLKTSSGDWVENSNFVLNSNGVDGFGQVVDASAKSFVVGAPQSSSSRGYVIVYTIGNDGIQIGHVITDALGAAGGRFGETLSVSDDGQWLYVGAPGSGKVFAYGRTARATTSQTITATGSNNDFTLTDQTITDASTLLVTSDVPFIPNVDYTIVNISGSNKLRFINSVGATTPPPAGSILVTYHDTYDLKATWTGPVGFGQSVKSNSSGSQVIIGSNLETVNGTVGTGKVYVYDRSIESFIVSGTQNTFSPSRPLQSKYRVTLNGKEMVQGTNYYVVNNNVQFVVTPAAGSIVNIETNYFTLVQSFGSQIGSYSQGMGAVVDICPQSCSVYAGAPNYSTPEYQFGAVYRFVNQGKLYGTITGTVANPTVTPGDSIRVNGVNIQFTESTLTHVINKINGSGVPGVVASNINGHLVIVSSSTVEFNKLDILPTVGTAINDLGLEIFVQAQRIVHPNTTPENEFFGSALKISDTSDQLVIGSKGGNSYLTTTFDGDTTTYDIGSTNLLDKVQGSGAAYVYDLMENPYENVSNPSAFAFVQQLVPNVQNSFIGTGFNFGSSIDVRNGYITVGANYHSQFNNGGGIFAFENASGVGGWDLIRYNEPRVDPESIDRIYIYNTKTKSILTRLDRYDPAKGKVLGIADADLDYVSEEDPAIYNDGNPGDGNGAGSVLSYDSSYHWSDLQEGRTWWDTSQVRFVDYEQGDLIYRSRHWGDMFPGSKIAVYEWVKSTYLPSQYVANGGNGTPKDENDVYYVSQVVVDPGTGLITTYYYYWVEGKTTVDINKTNRTNSVYTIAQILENPRDQGIPYAAAMAPNSVNLYNVTDYLTGTDVALHIDFSPYGDTNIIHSEYQLVQENSNTLPLPERIINKMQDSLAGIDSAGLAVPDPSLPVATRLGIGIRPRQTMFDNRETAVENFVKYINGVFALHPVAYTCDLTQLSAGEEIPVAGSGAWALSVATTNELDYIDKATLANGTRVLVNKDTSNDNLWAIYQWESASATWILVKIQGYYTGIYWELQDWYASDFDYTLKPTYTVDNYYQIETLSLVAGDTIKLNDNGKGEFIYYRVTDSLTLDTVGIQNGTIKLKDSVYDLASGNMAFDNDNFDTVRFDQNPIIEIRNIFSAVYNDIFIKDLKIEFNKLFFSLVNYIFSEQKSTDWIFKTSFLSVDHRIRQLIQYPSYVKDNQTFYEDYINEVKPYRSQIREYVPRYDGIDYLHAGATDFDLPASYDESSGTFRSPDGSRDTDATALSTTSKYADWNNNHKYKVVELVVDNPGSGYTLVPNVTISGGNGSGAKAILEINSNTGGISRAIVIAAGEGYTTTPTITVNGNGTGAVLSAKLKNVYYTPSPDDSYNTVRTFDTSLIFDRVGYSANVVDWAANTAYAATITTGIGAGNIWLSNGNFVQYNGKLYYPFAANVANESTFDSSLYQLLDPANVLVNAGERVMGYYQPTVGMPGRNLVSVINGIEYPGVIVDGADYANTMASMMDTSISSTFIDTSLGTRPEDINIDGGGFVDTFSSHAPEELLPGTVFDTLEIKVYTKISANTQVLGHRVFRNMRGNVEYLRISDYASTLLASNLSITDSNINVTNAAVLPLPNRTLNIPGVVFINGEKIVYWNVDYGNNCLTEIVRGVDGTGAPAVHLANARVEDSSIQQHVPNAATAKSQSFVGNSAQTVFTCSNINTIYPESVVVRVNNVPANFVLMTYPNVSVKLLTAPTTGANVVVSAAVEYPWLNMTANVADGTGFNGAVTSQVSFLKANVSYSP